MPKLKSKKNGTDIWSLITPEQFATATVSLGDRINQLDLETWRLNAETKLSTSVWTEVIEKLKIKHTEKLRHSLYNIWHLKRRDIGELIERELQRKNNNINDGDDGNIGETEEASPLEKNNSHLPADPSLPLPERPNTRANQAKTVNDNNIQHLAVCETSFILTPSEWKATLSCTRKELNRGWTDIFSNKLISCGFTCSVRFYRAHVKEGERKRQCKYFWCRAECTKKHCTRSYFIKLKDNVDLNTSPIFRVQISGIENHDVNIETMARHLSGVERYRVGERANKIGALAVFREHLQAADENLLAAGNYTGCETVEVLKKAAADYRKTNQIDENIFTACRIVASAYRKADVVSTTVEGYVQVVGEMPFRVHLFSEAQIDLYVDYCKKEKYSYVHLDATGGVLKKMFGQNQTLLYAAIFKNGTDCINTTPLAHAFLTDHTVPSITYFLGNLVHQITEFNKKLILPSFFVIDFSATLMNSILQAFNIENINTHLNRCWNVVNRNYNTAQLRSLSFIHLCCSHVIKAIARSLHAARIDKKIRRGVLHIFAFILCGNNLRQLYDILGLVIDIFGDPNEQNAREKFEKIVSLELDVDEESVTMLSDCKEILKEAKKKNNELKIVDEYFRSNIPIIHQSPFNQEAIRLYPNLKFLINNKSKYNNIVNPLFSPLLIRIFYRWWAYLPLWTGLLWNFEERYSNSLPMNASVIYNPIRHSNALIESYFRTLKHSVLGNRVGTQPQKIIEEIYRTVQVQLKGIKYQVTQSSKGRKRKMNKNGEWGKKGIGRKCRNVYGKAIDEFASKHCLSKLKNGQSNNVVKESSEEDTASTGSSVDQSSIISDGLNDKIFFKEPSQSSSSSSRSSSPKPVTMVNSEYSINARVNSDKLTSDDRKSELPVKSHFDNDDISNNMFSILNTMYSVDNPLTITTDQPSDQPSDQPEALIGSHTLRWPKFEIKNAIFGGRSYTLTLTCPIDSALFALYFIYRTDVNIAEKFDDAPQLSVYSRLVKVFRIVEKEGWDAARISWLLHFHLLKTTDRQPKSLFGSVDEQVFCFIKQAQRYSEIITCPRADCPGREVKRSSTEFSLLPSDTFVEKFECETVGVCETLVKRSNEITKEEGIEKQYRYGKIQIVNSETNRNEDVTGWICDSIKVFSVATFDYGHPPIIIANIRPFSERKEETHAQHHVQLSDMKGIIRIGSVKYKLRAVINHVVGPHFTTTLIDTNGTLYYFDDQTGVRQVRNSTKFVEYGIYSRIYTFDD